MALAQTGEIARRLTATVSDLDVEVVKFDTTGDIDQTSKLLLLTLRALVLDLGGGFIIEASRAGPAGRPRELGRAVAFDLLAKGAAEIIERSRPK
jgi:porphobilinogen deaminase